GPVPRAAAARLRRPHPPHRRPAVQPTAAGARRAEDHQGQLHRRHRRRQGGLRLMSPTPGSPTPGSPAPPASGSPALVTVKDYTTENKPDWCPGCGDFGILNALKKALVDLQKQPHEVTVIAGIGCSSKLPHWLNSYGFHTLHGRALPIATAARLANTRNDVIVI